jgi:hypothetical protein
MIAILPEWLSYRLSQPKQKAGSSSLLMIFFEEVLAGDPYLQQVQWHT